MSVLSIKEIVDFDKYNDELNPIEVFTGEGISTDHAKKVLEICKSFEEASDNSKAIILRSVSEEDFVRVAKAAQSATLMAMVSQGEGMSLMKSHMNGDLRGYTHTVVLAILGVLFNDGVV